MSDPKIVITTHTFEMLDTGIGQGMGYADDEAFRAAIQAERAAMDPEVRAAIEDVERRVERSMLMGDHDTPAVGQGREPSEEA